MNQVLERFAQRSPMTVMARAALERAFDPKWLDEMFEQESQSQYTRELLFSTVIEAMSLVVLGLRPSLNAAAKSLDLPVSVQSLYGKVKNSEPQVIRKLVSVGAERFAPVVQELHGRRGTPLLEGIPLRIVDGNHLPGSQKRLKVLRSVAGAALPGQSLVIYDPDQDQALDILPWEDGHAQERVLMRELMQRAKQGELWLMDRNFCTRPVIFGLTDRGSYYLIREHAVNAHPTAVTKLKRMGSIETGEVYEQQVNIEAEDGKIYQLRRIELRLKRPTEDGDWVLSLLTNLPARFKAKRLAKLYRRRWRIENMFQRLESVLQSEVRTLGIPRAALLAFAVAVLAYNALTLMKTAVRVKHERTLKKTGMEISPYYIAVEVRANYGGMLIAVPDSAWRPFRSMSEKEMAKFLLTLAGHVDPNRFRSHPRGPKIPKKKAYVSKRKASSHVATSRLLAAAA